MCASRAVQKHTQDQTPSRAKQTSQGQTQGLRQPENVLESSPPLHQYLGNSYVQAMSAAGGEMLQGPAVPPIVHSVPLRPSQSGILQRKCACGGAAGMSDECEECSKKQRLGLQTKLKVNEPGDIYEREADRVADQVLATPAHHAVSGAPPRIQRFSGQSNGQMNAAPASVDKALASPGRTLEPALRQDMEQRFGYDFSRVRVHSGAASEQSAREVNAHAYTVGQHMIFGVGRFSPGTHEGRRLIAHELTHVVQQSGSEEIRIDQAHEKRGLSPRTHNVHPLLQRDTTKVVTQSLHPEETEVFFGSFKLPFGGGRLYYSVELNNVPALMLNLKRAELDLECQAGIRTVLQELLKSKQLPSGLPPLRLRLDAGNTKVLNKGHVEGLVRRAAREEMKQLVAQSQKAKPAPESKAPSLRATAPVLAELASEVEGTFLPAIQGAKDMLPGVDQPPSPEEVVGIDLDAPAAVEPVAPAHTDIADECDPSDVHYGECLTRQRELNYKAGIQAAGVVAEAFLDPTAAPPGGQELSLLKLPGKLRKIRRIAKAASAGRRITMPNVLEMRRAGSVAKLDDEIKAAVLGYRSSANGSTASAFSRNFAAVRIRLESGETKIIQSLNIPKGAHSEEEILGLIKEVEKEEGSKVTVEQIFSERVPCPNCLNEVLRRHLGQDIDIFYFIGGTFDPNRPAELMKLYY